MELKKKSKRLSNVPLEERRKQAAEPLCLMRYE